ncbi:MAG: HAD family hydrolase [Candidatus Neomarinimicrobiota bacterium]
MNKKLFLFDIDGTLLSPGLLPRQILNRALADLAGASPDLQFVDVAGLTDPLIISNALQKLGITDGLLPVLERRVLERYLDELERDFPYSDLPVLYQDAVDFLGAVELAGHATALLTGNVERGAIIKLGRFGLFRRFAFGVYGSDSGERSDLPGIARERAQQVLGIDFSFSDLVIVGDTPNDARIACQTGARSVIVCRRPDWEAEIRAAGADIIVDNLNDTRRLLELTAAF